MSTATKLTYLNDTKGLLKDSINSLGGNITSSTTFRNYVTELDSIYASLPKVSGTGSILSLSPTRKGRLGSVINGDTFQQTYTGKNLLNATSNSHTFSTSDTNRLNLGIITLTAGTKYYISYTIENNTTSNTRNTPSLQLSGSSTSNYESANTNYNLTAGRKVWEFTPSESGTYNFGYWCNTPSNSVTVSNFMISTSSDTTYEQYVGGIASPNPDYPQEIKSVTGLQKVSVGGKNLFDGSIENIYFNSSYQFQNYTNALTTNYILANPGDIFTISCNAYSDGIVIASFDENYNCLLRNATRGTSLTHTCPAGTKYIIGSNVNGKNLNTQLEVGTEATTYEPYQSQEYEINLGTIKLNKIGDYQDYITGTPYNWSIKRQITEHTIINSDVELVSSYWVTTYGVYGAGIPKSVLGLNNVSVDKSSLCSVSSKINAIANISENTYIFNGNANYVFFFNSGFDTVEKAREKLNNATLYYNLDTETTEAITNTELISQLNALYYANSYNGTTNITITSQDLELIMTASAIKGEA